MTGENVHFGSIVTDAAGQELPAKDAPVALDVRNLGGEDFATTSALRFAAAEVLGISGASSERPHRRRAEAVAGLSALCDRGSIRINEKALRAWEGRRFGGACARRRLRPEEPA